MFLSLLQFFATKFLVLALHLESGSFPRPLSAQEEAEVFAALRAGDPAAREKLIRHNLRLVAHIVKKYYALPGDQDDLISIGTIGLIKAVDSYKSGKGVRLATYASRCIENEILMYLRRNNKIKSIHSSLKIEANSLTLGQVRDVINGKVVLGEQKEIQEVKNAYAAYERLSEIDPYDMRYLKRFHGMMTKYLVEESGEFRSGEEGVFNGDQCIFMAPPARLVPQLMHELFAWMKEARADVHPLILSSVFHYEFVFIHPFSDGNGRMARLWHTAILSKWKPVFEYLPIESQIEQFQDEYYAAISRCHVAGESTIFIEFMLSQIDRILEDISVQISERNEALPNAVRRLLDAMEYDVPYTSAALMEKLGMKSREGFRRNCLHPALQMNLVQMTIPDKPNSRNQRYVKI